MKPKTAPTSPKYDLEQVDKTLDTVWHQPEITPPPRLPLFTLALWSIIFAMVGLVIVLVGIGWYLRQVPNSRLREYLPATVTTIIENSQGGSQTEAPRAVNSFGETLVPLVVKPATDAVSTDAQITGSAIALSSAGWLVSVESALPSDGLVAATTPDRSPLTISKTVRDPAAPFVYLRAEGASFTPATFAGNNDVKPGQSVWVVVRRLTATVVVRRRLLPAPMNWRPGDQYTARWNLDEPVTAPPGSAVVLDDGRLVGLLGPQNAVWSAEAVESILKGLFEDQTVARAACGFSVLPTNAGTRLGTTTGVRVGAADGTTAITPEGPGDVAGLKAGDIITAVNGTTIDDWDDVLLAARPGREVTLTVRRGETDAELKMTYGLLRP